MPNPPLCGRLRAPRILSLVALALSGRALVAVHAGSLAGSVVSAETGTPIPGAVVRISGSALHATSDLNGAFRVDDVPAGMCAISVDAEGFRPAAVEDIAVGDERTARANVILESAGTDDAVELGELVISATAAAGSSLSLLSDRQKAPNLSDAIGADDFSRLAVGDAAEAMSKVTGASILDGRYVLIRGLGDRYANTLLNNLSIPSADPDKRAVQLDQIPASVLESIVTSKSFTPDQPGAFTGGSVNMRTKSFPDQFFLSVGTSVKFDDKATGESVLSIPGGGRDWTGMDDGTRALPRDIPTELPLRAAATGAAKRGDFAPAETLDRVSKSFHNKSYFPTEKEGGPGFGTTFAFGDRIDFGRDQVIGYVFSATYDRTTAHYENGIAGKYDQTGTDPTLPSFITVGLLYTPNLDDLGFAADYEANPETPAGEQNLGVTQTTDEVLWGLYGQIAYQPFLNHEVTLRYLRNQSASDVIKRGVGEYTRSEAGRLYEMYDLLYTERRLDSLQLSGKSLFPDLSDLRLEWRAATSTSTQDQPDYRSFSYFWDFGQQQYATASGVGNDRYFRDLNEDADELGADFSLPVFLRGRPGSLKFGGMYQDGTRTYRERGFRWEPSPNRIELIENFPNPVGIIDRTENSVTLGSTISELTNNLSQYDGEQTIWGAYGMADLTLSDRWRVIGGVRAEGTEIDVGPIAGSDAFESASIDQTDVLPAASVVYQMSNDMNIRAAWGRTIARPLYHELAGIRVQNKFRQHFHTGDPDLEMSSVDNFDLRWEWFRGGRDMYAVGVFHKEFTNPIEVLYVAKEGSEKPRNLEHAQVTGAEFEARFNLGMLGGFLEPFSLGGNLAIMRSEEQIPDDELAVIRTYIPDARDTRPLFNQSPYVVNVDLSYSHARLGTSVTLALNVAGERLALVTDNAAPDIYEQPAPRLDLMVGQRLSARWRLRLSAKNLLAPDYEKTITHLGRTFFYERYRTARSFGLSLSYFFE